MTLIVETGAGLANAESYAAVSDADTYHTGRGNTAWTGTTADKEAALRRATDYIGETYRDRWAGNRATTTQALDWPRFYVRMRDGPGMDVFSSYYPTDAVPAAVSRACMELALKALSGPLNPDLGQAVKSKRVGQVEIAYQDWSSATKTYPAIDNLLAPLLGAGGGTRVVRA